MLTSIRSLAAATILSSSALLAAPALASDNGGAIVDTSVDVSSLDTVSLNATPAATGAIGTISIDSDALSSADAATSLETSGAVIRTSQPVEDSNKAGETGLTVSGSVTLVTDYRFRGVSLSAGDPAIQGGITVTHDSGVYVGTWASSIAGGAAYGDMELDLIAGWSGDVSDGVTFDIGMVYFVYPTNDGAFDPVDYWEPYATVSTTLGPVEASLGINYAWKQDSLGGNDNLYLHGELGVGIPNTPVSLSAHLGYTSGALAPDYTAGLSTDKTAWDWSIGASMTVLDKLEIGVSYIGVEAPQAKALGVDDGFTDGTIVGTLGVSF